jgi:hypothetical protein
MLEGYEVNPRRAHWIGSQEPREWWKNLSSRIKGDCHQPDGRFLVTAFILQTCDTGWVRTKFSTTLHNHIKFIPKHPHILHLFCDSKNIAKDIQEIISCVFSPTCNYPGRIISSFTAAWRSGIVIACSHLLLQKLRSGLAEGKETSFLCHYMTNVTTIHKDAKD